MPLEPLGQMGSFGGASAGGSSELRTSFIPKKPMVASTVKRESSTAGVFMLISVLIFITTGLAWGGVYWYGKVVDSSIATLKASIQKVEENYGDQIGLINEMVGLDSRLRIVGQLLASHATLQPLFQLLDMHTVKSLRFKDFSYNQVDADRISVKLSGEAKSYSSIALNSQELALTRSFKNIIFSDLNPGLTGNVVFKMTSDIVPDTISYKEMLKKETQ